MPIRTRLLPKPQAARKVRQRNTWPFPPGVGDAIPAEFRHYYVPKDDYYYILFSYANTKEETEDNFKIIGEAGLPFEYSMSPSGCICYRLHRKYENLPEIQIPVGPRDTVPVFLPGKQYGKRVQWRMSQQCILPYLHLEWKPVPSLKRNIRRRTT